MYRVPKLGIRDLMMTMNLSSLKFKEELLKKYVSKSLKIFQGKFNFLLNFKQFIQNCQDLKYFLERQSKTSKS